MNIELIIQDQKESNMIFKDFESFANYRREIESKILDIRFSLLATADMVMNILNDLDLLEQSIKGQQPIIDRGVQ